MRDVRLPGPAVRFDYQDLDPAAGRLYLAHQRANQVMVVDLASLEVIGTVGGLSNVHGVRVASNLGRLFATATGTNQVTAIDLPALEVSGRTATGRFPDGLAYDPATYLLFVSNKDDGSETILDARNGQALRTLDLGEEVGNVQRDPVTGRMLVAVQSPDALVAIEPASGRIVQRVDLSECEGPHGVALDEAARLAFVACEDNARLALVDLYAARQVATATVGEEPDVLAFDPGLHRLYVAAESGVVAVFEVRGQTLRKLSQAKLHEHAHSVSVDPRTHRVFFPLEEVNGHPVLRVMEP